MHDNWFRKPACESSVCSTQLPNDYQMTQLV